MNVLVYSGAEILPLSSTNVLASLRSTIFPHYSVQPITQSTLTSQPWRTSCALIVLPQFQKPHCGLTPVANKQIGDFVEAGGKCLIFGAKARIKSRHSSGLDVGMRYMMIGLEDKEELPLPLKFYDKNNNCYVAFDEEDNLDQDGNPHITTLITSDGVNLNCFRETGSGDLVGFDVRNVSVLARYEPAEHEEFGRLACLSMKICDGQLTLSSPNIEYPLTQEPALSLLSSSSSSDVRSFESSRSEFLRRMLQDLGLNIPNNVPSSLSSHPLPQLLTSAHHCSPALSRAIRTTFRLGQDFKGVLKDANDEFQFHSFDRQHALELLASSRRNAVGDISSGRLRHILVCGDGVFPDRQITPLFDLDAYFKALGQSRENSGLKSTDEHSWGIGEALLYGEVVTSTQTMLDKNPFLLSHLPVPFLSLASHQLAGRGRGSNSWLSPLGCLLFSLLLRVQLSSTPTTPPFPPAKLVFIQYLFSLAVVEACRDEKVFGERLGSKVRLKWPNDIYADFGVDGKEDFKKVGGILVNTNFEGGRVDIVIGCGLNVLNKPPIPSLALLHQLNSIGQKGSLSLESTAAVIMARFESMWNVFLHERSFEPFMGLYIDRWLHSNQRVLLTTMNPHTPVRIVGITTDHGLLRTVPERRAVFNPWSSRSGETEYIDLQPDGNSFDLMAGLIKTKT